jgi:hypothetical protein
VPFFVEANSEFLEGVVAGRRAAIQNFLGVFLCGVRRAQGSYVFPCFFGEHQF